jgi:PHD/YefM family antitoxin component YafN of YafNO toxin-antitoxin module
MDILRRVPLTTKSVSGNEVRIPDPEAGKATVISRYGKERAMLIHPADFNRLTELERLLEDAAKLEPMAFGTEAVRAHIEEDTPGKPITDPTVLAKLFD